MTQYIRLCADSVNTKGTLLKLTDNTLDEIYKKINKENPSYSSVYMFNDEHFKQFEKTGSVAGITDVVTNQLIFDFDDRTNIGHALEDARTLVKRLYSNGFKEENVAKFFSGHKGFGVVVYLNEFLKPNEVKNICSNLATGLETFDTSVYNATRILRLPLTKHEKSGLYKIPLTDDELNTCSVQQIKDLARENVDFQAIKNYWRSTSLPTNLKQIKDKVVQVKTNTAKVIALDLASLNREAMPKGWDLPRWALFNGFFDEGSRSTALLCLASFLAKSYTADHTYRMLKGTCEIQSQRTGSERFPDTELYNNIIMQVYGPSWKGGTYSLTDPSSWLYQYAKETGLLEEASQTVSKDILTTEQVGKLFEDFALNIDKNRIKFGIKDLDEALDILVGRVYVIAGSPGSGKSSLLIQIFEGLSEQGNKAIYFSFDMSLQDNFQKIIQKEFKITAKQVFEQYKDPARREVFHKVFNEKYGNIIFINSSGMTIESMRDRIIQAEKVHGEIKVVAVDYMTLTQSEKGDSNEHSKAVIQGLKAIATDMRKCVISINQPNKANQKINEPLSGYGGIQGSSAVQELANVILWCYRPGANPQSFADDKFYSIECMKNRHGAMFAVDLNWNGLTGTVSSMTPAQKLDLERLRRELKESKSSKVEDGF
jgi:archaellum biogenesis ATPase FlaH